MISEAKKLELWKSLRSRGRSLAQYGSGEYGLNIYDAIEFIGLVKQAGLSILGIEKWTFSDGNYTQAGLDGWYSDTDADSESNYACALAYLKEDPKDTSALYAIQF